jgi:hypothetical protein
VTGSDTCYLLHGLSVSSEIPIPGLSVHPCIADVRIRAGVTPESLEQPTANGVLFSAAPGEYLLKVKNVAAYWAKAGREIVVDRVSGASDDEVLSFLLGHAFSAVLHQRGVLALHASGVVGAHGAVLIAGYSGRGKSTVTAELVDRGFAVLTDDVAAAGFDENGLAVVHRGVPQVRLWSDAIRRRGQDPERLTQVRAGVAKYVVPMPAPDLLAVYPIRAVFVLEFSAGDTVDVVPIEHSEAFAELRRHTRTPRVMEGLGMSATHFAGAARLADRVPLVRIRRPRGRWTGDEIASVIAPVLS